MLARLRRLRHPPDPNSLPALIAEGVVEWGEHSYGEPRVIAYRSPTKGLTGGRVVIGRYCAIGGGVTFHTGGNHVTDRASTFPFRNRWDLPGRDEDGQTYTKGDIRVGSDVWIGENALILSGVTIGHGAVIAAASVVVKDVEPYAIMAGNPARVLRYRHPPDVIASLLEIAWWNWPESKVRENVDLLNGPDVRDFIARCR